MTLGHCGDNVQTLIRDHKTDINAKDDENTPLHVGKKKVKFLLINKLDCIIKIKGSYGS